MVCAGTCADPKNNLVGHHAYTVLGVKEDENLGRLVNLRNPWGKTRYNGPWSFSWLVTRGFNREAKELYKCGKDEFWMPFTEFVKVNL